MTRGAHVADETTKRRRPIQAASHAHPPAAYCGRSTSSRFTRFQVVLLDYMALCRITTGSTITLDCVAPLRGLLRVVAEVVYFEREGFERQGDLLWTKASSGPSRTCRALFGVCGPQR
jgi:hypothetical protein